MASVDGLGRFDCALAVDRIIPSYFCTRRSAALHDTPDAINNDRLFEFQDRDMVGNSHAADLLVQKFEGFRAGFALSACCGVEYREKVGDGVGRWAWAFPRCHQ
jgi:hypothetical protein